MRDSLRYVHPRNRARWLRDRGIADPVRRFDADTDSGPLRVVGRWSYGPSYDVDGRVTASDTLVALARGSGVSLIRFARTDSIELELLADVNAQGLVHRVWVQDTLLYLGSAAGLEIWDIADERRPARLSWTPIPLNDFCVQESLAYVIGADDSFRVYSAVVPENPYQVGVCRDSGSTIAVTGGVALVGDRWGLFILDVGDPANPHRANSWGGAIKGVTARGDLAFVSTFNPNEPGWLRLTTLDVSDPDNIRQLGYLQDAGGFDLHLIDTLAFCSGDQYDNELRIVSVADSTAPRLLGTGVTTGWNWGVWASGLSRSAFVADLFDGVQVFDVQNTSAPFRDTAAYGADLAYDVVVDNGKMYVADLLAGLRVVDVTDPSSPRTLGSLDIAGGSYPVTRSVAAKDSFAFVGWTPRPQFRSVDVSDPTCPSLAGGYDVFNWPEDMALRDSLLYLAENRRLQIVNVARPREPVLVGSCVLPDDAVGLWVKDTLAYVAYWPLSIVNIADPTAPTIVSQVWRGARNVTVVDTVAFLAAGLLVWYSVADPAAPYLMDSISIGHTVYGMAVADTVVYASTLDRLFAVSVSNLHRPYIIASASLPKTAYRVTYAEPYLYAACSEAGVCVFETVSVGIGEITRPGRDEGAQPLEVIPNPNRGRCILVGKLQSGMTVAVRDVSGRTVLTKGIGACEERRFVLDVSGLNGGVYFVEVSGDGRTAGAKFVKQR